MVEITFNVSDSFFKSRDHEGDDDIISELNVDGSFLIKDE